MALWVISAHQPLFTPFECLCAFAAIAGTLSHLAIFIRKEWHMTAPYLVWAYASLVMLLFCGVHVWLPGRQISCSIRYTAAYVIFYCTGLFTSIVVYRRYFHRLRSFPGPWQASVTKLWHVWKCRGGQNHLLIEQLHHKYGSIIRTGPEELTIIDPHVPQVLDGPGNTCEKAVWYDFLLPEVAVNTTRSKKDHDFRRRIWDQGFSTKALNAYEHRILSYTETLTTQIDQISREGGAVVVTDWFYWYSFDVIGDVAFSRSFNMLRDKQWHFAVKLLRRAMSLLGPFSPVPWLAQIAFHFFPWMYLVRDWFKMLRWCKRRMEERIKSKMDRSDVARWLIEASQKEGSLTSGQQWLNGDAIAILIAGSDTVASTLVFAMFELACNQSRQHLLYDELQNLDVHNREQLQHCDYLNAIINETLRLHPAVPTGGYRQSSPAGAIVNKTFVPGNVTIVSPRYSIGRLESCYEQPRDWIPERWTTKKELIKSAQAFSPFSTGRYSCVGKNLAMIELRFVISMLVKRFRIDLSDVDRGDRLFSDYRDHFTAAPGRLELRFHPRT
ncbi:cytochrome P450 [Xylaria nigripes]|nr:cytochrome P450 [Xylaria nigripes]